ncbi:cytidine deaminase [Membranihabitans maritimus]|uniref:cytidine deaminase n=1 Tax=Membranihabitans maritimus TaxID=2904244 RepID=UPI001F01C79B|nr:cytidine deaminase [Membranihabitans maritimus]
MAHRTLTIEYEEFNVLEKLPEDEQILVHRAREARKFSHSPYSNFRVGTAISTREGHIVVGSNQETSNHKSSCAERVALDTASAAGLKNQIAKIAVAGNPGINTPAAPCGQCRQDIKEVEDLSDNPIVIILAGQSKVMRFVGVSNLLPFAFGNRDM